MLKNLIKTILPKGVTKTLVTFRDRYLDGYALKSYSQEGEDMILRALFVGQQKGFYIDVGAHHPKRFSNTYYFYRRGWNGINIDAMPGSMKAFRKVRPRDINIEKPVSDKKQLLTYYAFNEPALNGFSKELSKQRATMDDYSIEFTRDIETSTLESILIAHLPENQQIDFLSIDVEGWDLRVLRSTNLEKYRPKVILIEMLRNSISQIENSEITEYLGTYSYSFYAKAMNSVFFISDSYFNERHTQ